MWNKNERDGKVREVTGKATQAVAAVTGNKALAREGVKAEKAGQAQSAIGRTRRKAGEALEAAGKAIKR